MHPVEVTQGDSPIVLGLPHTGTFVPDDVADRLNETGRALADTDWHIHTLYDQLLPHATTVRATFHRYVVDANRDPGGQKSLYPGQNTTSLVPLTDFDGKPIWHAPPDEDEVERRRAAFHAPYHDALSAQLERVRHKHGVAILYDCHSIRSEIPFLFDGTLPDFNIGTNLGATCARQVEASVINLCEAETGYTTTVNGRFKGGWTTRHYGRPETDVHAIQMELAQSTYLQTEYTPWAMDTAKADRLRSVLARLLSRLADLAPQLKGTP
ncbi:MAG: N-formylglutamate deformylase [Pseudomonadota bacterium]